jgi:hypothetical protein
MDAERLEEQAEDEGEKGDVKTIDDEEVEGADVLEEFAVGDGSFLFEAEGDGLDKAGDFGVVVDAGGKAALEELAGGAGPGQKGIAFALGEEAASLGVVAGELGEDASAGEVGGEVEFAGVARRGDGSDGGGEGELIAPSGGRTGPVDLDREGCVEGAIGGGKAGYPELEMGVGGMGGVAGGDGVCGYDAGGVDEGGALT